MSPAAEKGSGVTLATRDSAALFAPVLVDALRADAQAQARSPQEIVGLDGDPFLDAQDFCESYEIGGARHRGDHVLVDVYGVCSGQRHSQPDVVAELSRRDSSWVFVDFQYPTRQSTLTRDLGDLRRSRGKSR